MNPKVGILNIGIGNIGSIYNALYENAIDAVVIEESIQLDSLSHVIMPGVGNFQKAMENLHLHQAVKGLLNFAATGKPILGICLGMQLLATRGTEGGECQGLGLIPGSVQKIQRSQDIRLPHVGWNEVTITQHHPVFEGIRNKRDFYFVHSFEVLCESRSNIFATTNYAGDIVCAIGTANVFGVQFHPEKSQVNGLRLLENFCNWDGKC